MDKKFYNKVPSSQSVSYSPCDSQIDKEIHVNFISIESNKRAEGTDSFGTYGPLKRHYKKRKSNIKRH